MLKAFFRHPDLTDSDDEQEDRGRDRNQHDEGFSVWNIGERLAEQDRQALSGAGSEVIKTFGDCQTLLTTASGKNVRCIWVFSVGPSACTIQWVLKGQYHEKSMAFNHMSHVALGF